MRWLVGFGYEFFCRFTFTCSVHWTLSVINFVIRKYGHFVTLFIVMIRIYFFLFCRFLEIVRFSLSDFSLMTHVREWTYLLGNADVRLFRFFRVRGSYCACRKGYF